MSYSEYHTRFESIKIYMMKRGTVTLSSTYTSVPTKTISFLSNTMSYLNFLKNTPDQMTDSLSRIESYMPEIYDSQLQNQGLIIELYGNFTGGTLLVQDNKITDIQQYFKGEANNHCDLIFE